MRELAADRGGIPQRSRRRHHERVTSRRDPTNAIDTTSQPQPIGHIANSRPSVPSWTNGRYDDFAQRKTPEKLGGFEWSDGESKAVNLDRFFGGFLRSGRKGGRKGSHAGSTAEW